MNKIQNAEQVLQVIKDLTGLKLHDVSEEPGVIEFQIEADENIHPIPFERNTWIGKECIIKHAGRILLSNSFGPMVGYGYQEVAYGQINKQALASFGWSGENVEKLKGIFLRTDTVDDGEVFIALTMDGYLYINDQDN